MKTNLKFVYKMDFQYANPLHHHLHNQQQQHQHQHRISKSNSENFKILSSIRIWCWKTFYIIFFCLNRVTLLSNECLNELKSKHTLQTSWTTQTQKVGFINTSAMFCSKTFISSSSSAFSVANHKILVAEKFRYIYTCIYHNVI